MDKAQVRRQVADERGEVCVFCGIQASDLHHAIIGHKKSLDKKLFVKYNLVPSCNDCNARKREGDNRYHHHYFWLEHCQRYGEEIMISWLDGVNDGLVIPYTPQIEPEGYIEWESKNS